MKVLILAGGYGTRLYPIIKDTPKALLEVKQKPLIDYILNKFESIQGIEEVVVVTNDKFSGHLTQWSQKHAGLPFSIRVINDGTRTPEERLGAIGDILFVLDKEKAATDWVIAGSDNLFDGGVKNFIEFARTKEKAVTVGAYDIKDISSASKYGVMALDQGGKIISLEEKPKNPKSSLISMCLYFLPKASLPLVRQFIDETHAMDTTGGYIQWLYKKFSVYGFKFSGKWYDIGSLESYNEAQNNFSE
ncbi:MAG: nucleotidyltransferase family protein [Candidatus Omnitrophica bacterium]|nr:nucleotidyltransferase family protein [Candidatus Omnitrophota bacterium]